MHLNIFMDPIYRRIWREKTIRSLQEFFSGSYRPKPLLKGHKKNMLNTQVINMDGDGGRFYIYLCLYIRILYCYFSLVYCTGSFLTITKVKLQVMQLVDGRGRVLCCEDFSNCSILEFRWGIFENDSRRNWIDINHIYDFLENNRCHVYFKIQV